MTTYQLHESTPAYLKQVRSHIRPYLTRVEGKTIIVHPGVMSPRYDPASAFLARNLPPLSGRVLDVGTGTGVLAVHAAADEVHAADINASAVDNARENFVLHGLDPRNVHHADLFDGIPTGKWDAIIFNAPYHGAAPSDDLERGVTDDDYQTLERFLAEAPGKLTDEGMVVLGFSDTGDVRRLHRNIHGNQLRIASRTREDLGGWNALAYKLEPITFASKEQRYIHDDDAYWHDWMWPHIKDKNVLKVGTGLGYLDDMLAHSAGRLVVLGEHDYDGRRIPHDEDAFDVAIASYMLHHARHRDELLAEMQRVARKVAVIEEQAPTLRSRLEMIHACWKTNRKADQEVTIRPTRYYRSGELEERLGADVIDIQVNPRGSYENIGIITGTHHS